MPLISGGYKVLAHFPDGTEKVLTLYAEPVEGKVIPHGWVVVSVTPRGDDKDGVRLDWEISVERPRLTAEP
jgi:hypothetical protein